MLVSSATLSSSENLSASSPIVVIQKKDMQSFSGYAWRLLNESNFFNPSDYILRPIEDKRSLTESLLEVDFTRSRKITSWSHTLLKPLRAIAFYAALLGIGVFIAPMGAVYHGSKALWFTAKTLCGGELKQAYWEKAKDYANCFFIDFGSFFYSGTQLIFFCATFEAALIAYTLSQITAPLIFWTVASVCSALYCLHVLSTIIYVDETLTFYGESDRIKRNYGLIAENGNLLSHNPLFDGTYNEYHLLKNDIKQEQFFILIAKLQKSLLIKNQPLLVIEDYRYIEKSNKKKFIIDTDQIIKKIQETFDKEEKIDTLSRNEWIENLKSLGGSLAPSKTFYIYPQDNQTTFFSTEEEVYRNSFSNVSIHSFIILRRLYDGEIEKIYKNQPAPNEEFADIRRCIILDNTQRIKRYWYVFDFETEPTDYSFPEFEKRFRHTCKQIHPNNVADEFKAEARILYYYVTEAFRIAKASQGLDED